MNLLSLILVAMAIIAAACVFYVAWEFSSGKFDVRSNEKPDESKDSPGS
jgi:flagellar basal body-associated protein FliL